MINIIVSLITEKIALTQKIILDNLELIAGLMIIKFVDKMVYHHAMFLMDLHALLIMAVSV